MAQHDRSDLPYCVVLNTCPDKDTALRVADTLVKEKWVACVNIIAGVTSVYPWKGKIETGEEVLLLMKTQHSAYAGLESRLKEIHPYELPEIIKVSITGGLDAYLGWITESVSNNNGVTQ